MLTKRKAREIDFKATRQWGISSLIMMENAGIRIADFCLKLLKKKNNKRVAVFCGKGNNCGDGLVVSRQLIAARINVDTYLLSPVASLSPPAKKNWKILSKLTKKIYRIETRVQLEKIDINAYGLLIDAIFGIGLRGRVDGIFKEVIQKINCFKRPTVVCIDIPSGLDANRGCSLGCAVKADYTVSLIAAKRGLLVNQGKDLRGKLVIRHIGFPCY
jgi:hydroxyethylthiazole kinase-like uncharacterized protein yjeF